MKKKVFSLVVCTLLITILFSFSATAKKCERNLPPDTPTVDIPENVIKGHWIFIKTITTDPDNDNVYVYWDWDDGTNSGWLGPYTSGHEICENHLEGCPLYIRHIAIGDPAKETLKLVEDEGVDMIVMATHGRSGIGRWALGSVADRVIRHSKAPVLMVRASKRPASRKS